ncbi:hypothetical protein [Streptomyces parvus]|uniref:hypothetical protein n=1 Tax=Streptomyces parvus TaxID=66428 RepID=UPI003681A65D
MDIDGQQRSSARPPTDDIAERSNGQTVSVGSPLTRDDPERIGGYWLAARLGFGGQGVVYEAYDAPGARYALKTLHQDAGDFLRARFAREAVAAQ